MTNSDGKSATKGRRGAGGTDSLSPLPSFSSLSSLEGRNRTGDDKKMEATQSSRQGCPFIFFQDNHVGFYMYITANYQSLLPPDETKKAGGSEEVVAQLLHNTFFPLTLAVWKNKSDLRKSAEFNLFLFTLSIFIVYANTFQYPLAAAIVLLVLYSYV